MIIISIGVDCGMRNFLRKYNLTNTTMPFDWVVTYNGVSKCIDDDFNYFIEPLDEKRINKYDTYFHHDFDCNSTYNEHEEKYIRRCNRLINILETSNDTIMFCRKGHSCHHHHENDSKYSNIANDIDDCENLDKVISKKYPNLNYKIVVILVCDKCFNPNETYKSNSEKIEIYNIATPQADDAIFEKCCRDIFKI